MVAHPACVRAGVSLVLLAPLPPPRTHSTRPAADALDPPGSQTANLTGAVLSTPFSSEQLTIANSRECAANGTLGAGRLITFTQRSEANPCGFPFTLNAT